MVGGGGWGWVAVGGGVWRCVVMVGGVGGCCTLGVRGDECPVIPPVHWKGVALPRQRSSKTLKTLSNLKAYIVGFLQLRDFCI